MNTKYLKINLLTAKEIFLFSLGLAFLIISIYSLIHRNDLSTEIDFFFIEPNYMYLSIFLLFLIGFISTFFSLIKCIRIRFKRNHFWYHIDSRIIKVSYEKFIDGYYADSVESAFKEINKKIKEIYFKSTGKEYDGADLMSRAFNSNNPIIKISDVTNENGRNIQEGFMHMFIGAMKGIRNPNAHDNLVITKEEALEYIYFANLLIRKV